MKPQPAFVGAQRARELHAVAAVHLLPSVVVQPRHAEVVHAFGLGDGFEHLDVARLAPEDGHEVVRHLLEGLQELALFGVSRGDAPHQRGDLPLDDLVLAGPPALAGGMRQPAEIDAGGRPAALLVAETLRAQAGLGGGVAYGRHQRVRRGALRVQRGLPARARERFPFGERQPRGKVMREAFEHRAGLPHARGGGRQGSGGLRRRARCATGPPGGAGIVGEARANPLFAFLVRAIVGGAGATGSSGGVGLPGSRDRHAPPPSGCRGGRRRRRSDLQIRRGPFVRVPVLTAAAAGSSHAARVLWCRCPSFSGFRLAGGRR
mmetsp:Transcript_1053/g.4135  ORF Transcript_1053/g.4135 Transcript_1053/m.4135 type:complete len:320 (-) Transcript_1053:292-1251(-)